MNRIAIREEGYDCLNRPCQHTPKGNHGICGEHWWFVVEEYGFAFGLSILSQAYPKSVAYSPSVTIQAECVWHALEPRGEVWVHEAQCPFLTDKPCFWTCGNYELGTALVERSGISLCTYNQNFEPLWHVLEEEFQRQAVNHHTVAERTMQRCPTCNGEGHLLLPWKESK